MKNILSVYISIIVILFTGCRKEEPVYDQLYLDILSGEWIVEEITYTEEEVVITNPEITFHFDYCNIREQERGTCTGYYKVKDLKSVEFEIDVDRARQEIYFDVINQEEDNEFKFDQDTLGLDASYFNVIEMANNSVILKGLTTFNDISRNRETEYILKRKN